MRLEQYFPIWDQLTADEQAVLNQAAVKRLAPKGTRLHNGSADCVGPVSYTHLDVYKRQ